MELKLAISSCADGLRLRSNRTFMELKQQMSFQVLAVKLVLIVPLWN